jgi:hypothetical protein
MAWIGRGLAPRQSVRGYAIGGIGQRAQPHCFALVHIKVASRKDETAVACSLAFMIMLCFYMRSLRVPHLFVAMHDIHFEVRILY